MSPRRGRPRKPKETTAELPGGALEVRFAVESKSYRYTVEIIYADCTIVLLDAQVISPSKTPKRRAPTRKR